jgi:hypothetical protein
MKVIIEFSDEDAAEDAKTALDGWRWKHSMWELDQELRNRLKYEDNMPDVLYKAIESLRDKIREILSDNNLTME